MFCAILLLLFTYLHRWKVILAEGERREHEVTKVLLIKPSGALSSKSCQVVVGSQLVAVSGLSEAVAAESHHPEGAEDKVVMLVLVEVQVGLALVLQLMEKDLQMMEA